MDKKIRFINSKYDELFKIHDGGVVEVTFPDRQFSVKCEYVDDYHMKLGYNIFHICQFAEMLERGGGSCRPEPIVLEQEAAWDVGGKGYLTVQTCDSGYDYTLYDFELNEIDGGQIDEPDKSINAIRDGILEDYGWNRKSMTMVDYDSLMEKVDEKETKVFSEERISILESLSELKGVSSDTITAKAAQEVER